MQFNYDITSITSFDEIMSKSEQDFDIVSSKQYLKLFDWRTAAFHGQKWYCCTTDNFFRLSHEQQLCADRRLLCGLLTTATTLCVIRPNRTSTNAL